jgi:hypothetical protein
MRFLLLLFFLPFALQAQNMTPERLEELIRQEADSVQTQNNMIQFKVNQSVLLCIYDANANRMRIISPIVERSALEEKDLLNALVANFHSALDVRYALSDEIIWSVYTHPLQQLSDAQVVDAIQQVYAAALTFGNTFSSTGMIFPGGGNSRRIEKERDSVRKF